MKFQVDDFVSRKSYNCDLVFRIDKIYKDMAILRSIKLRLMADAPIDDLVKVEKDKKIIKKELMMESYEFMHRQWRHQVLNNRLIRNGEQKECLYQEYRVKVLHIDGDQDYLKLSMLNYKNLNINAKGFFIPEKGQPEKISELLEKMRPDILVITGHDGEFFNKAHHTSDYFIKTVEIARSFQPDLDQLVIFAGACQSDYNQLIEGGANFASSPQNKLIHFLDPILVVEKIASTSVREFVPVKDVINNTITGLGGVGGVETRGKLRLKYP
ncbi:MAG: sporulation peptidase YabG [Halanaerobiaceae bacterium]|nr:sporulation peptidase YabG [Halanaerobiaceae bacterium]